jgi:aspartate aminotransferase-like enzyme
MIGHRGSDFETLFARIQLKLRQVFATRSRVYVSTSSGTGLQEAAVRNCVQKRCLNLVNGAFSERWHGSSRQRQSVREAPGTGHPPGVESSGPGRFGAITVVHARYPPAC